MVTWLMPAKSPWRALSITIGLFFVLISLLAAVSIFFMMPPDGLSTTITAAAAFIAVVIIVFANPAAGLTVFLFGLAAGKFILPQFYLVSDAWSELLLLSLIIGFFGRYLSSRRILTFSIASLSLGFFSLCAVISGISALMHYLTIEPVPGSGFVNLQVNVWGVTANEAIRSCLLSTINYFSWGALLLAAENHLSRSSTFKTSTRSLLASSLTGAVLIAWGMYALLQPLPVDNGQSVESIYLSSPAFRTEVFENAVSVAVGKPLAGVGPGNYSVQVGNITSAAGKPFYSIEPPGNQYLTIAAETGLPGIALFLLAIVSVPVVFLGRHKRRSFRFYNILHILPFFTGVLFLLVFRGLAYPVWSILIWINAALLTCKGNDKSENPFPQPILAITVLIIGLAAVVVSSAGAIAGRQSLNPLQQWEKLRWPLDAGFYDREETDSGDTIQWTGPLAVRSLTANRHFLYIKWSIPERTDTGIRPVVTISFGNRVLERKELFNTGWNYTVQPVDATNPLPEILVIETKPAFIPSSHSTSRDTRKLGIAIAEIRFIDELPEQYLGFSRRYKKGDGGFRWSGVESFISVPLNKGKLKFTLRAGHSNIVGMPVTVSFDLQRSLVGNTVLRNLLPHEITIDPAQMSSGALPARNHQFLEETHGILRLSVDRGWKTGRGKAGLKQRLMGVAVSDIRTIAAGESDEVQ